VPRPTYPPYDFTCPYTDNCPHLNGLSTKWVFGEYQRADDVYHEHLRIIDNFYEALKVRDDRIRVLERDNAELKAKYQALHQKQFKANKKTRDADRQDEGDGVNTERKKRGAPVGHPGWFRPPPKRIDRRVSVSAPETCPHCGSDKLTPLSETTEHLQEDIVLVARPKVTLYLHGEAYCPKCRRSVMQAAEDELLHAPIGPVAKSTAIYFRYRIGVSYRKVQEILRELFGLDCVPASLVGFDRKAASNATAIYNDLKEKIRSSSVVHADETSWRNDGIGHFVWYAGNDDLAFFHIDRHRSAEVAKAIFGENFAGTLVRDRYAAYNGIGVDWQSCLAHIITRTKEISREYVLLPSAERDNNVVPFLDHVMDLCLRACEVGQKLTSGDILREAAASLEKQFVEELNNICKQSLRFKPAETLRAYLAGPDQTFLFTFLRRPGVPPTNNQAEQSMRHMVIFRKICFGTRSESGLKTHSILPSLVQTARRQGVQPLDFLQTLLTADSATAQAALYNNST
jgi:transposase